MAIPSNGITAEVIRDFMPPYHLSLDLLQATFATLPAPPSDATTAWRHARITRLTEEIVAPKPADAGQARISAQLLIVRELADTFAKTANAPDLPIEQMCRLGRTASGLLRTSIELDRALARHQQKVVPFFGTVVQDEVDIAAVDAMWPSHPAQPSEAPPPRKPPRDAAPPAIQTDAAPAIPRAIPTPPQSVDRAATSPQPQPDRPPHPATNPEPSADTTPEWSITKLDEGPGWSREVLRHRSSQQPGAGAPARVATK